MGGRSEKKSSRILKNGSCKLKRGKKKSSLKPSLDQLRLTAVVVLLRPPHLIIGRYTKSFVRNNDLGHKCPSPMNIIRIQKEKILYQVQLHVHGGISSQKNY